MSFDNCIRPCTAHLSGGVRHFHQPGQPLTSPVKSGPVPGTRPGGPCSDFRRHRKFCRLLEFTYTEPRSLCLPVSGFSRPARRLGGFTLPRGSVVCFPYGCIVFYCLDIMCLSLSFLQLVGIWDVDNLWQLQTKLRGTFSYKFSCRHMLSSQSWTCDRSRTAWSWAGMLVRNGHADSQQCATRNGRSFRENKVPSDSDVQRHKTVLGK